LKRLKLPTAKIKSVIPSSSPATKCKKWNTNYLEKPRNHPLTPSSSPATKCKKWNTNYLEKPRYHK
jgi:hypothetical protein